MFIARAENTSLARTPDVNISLESLFVVGCRFVYYTPICVNAAVQTLCI